MTSLSLPRARQPRGPRVPFQAPVRVFAENNPTTYRVLSVDLSDGGMFLQMPMPFASGTKVSLALEAGGKVLPFAEGEVAWRRTLPLPEAVKPGAAVRFTSFKSKRANLLVRDLVEALHHGKQPKPYSPVRLNRWIVAIVASTLIGIVAGLGYGPHPSPAPARPLLPETGNLPAIEFTEVDEPAVPELPALADAVGRPSQWLELNASPPAGPAPRPRVWAWRPKTVAPPVAELAPVTRHPLHAVPLAGAIAIGATRAVDSKHLPTEARAAPAQLRAPPDGKPHAIAIPAGAMKAIHLVTAGKGFRFDFELAKGSKLVHLTTLKDPSRLAIDLAGPAPKKPMVVAGVDGIQRVRLARFGNGTRVVLDLTMPVTVVEQSGTHVVVAPE